MAIRPRVQGNDSDPFHQPVGNQPDRESQLSAITKWVPIEVIALYEGVTQPFGKDIAEFLPAAVLVGVGATFVWIAFATEDAQARSRIAWRQVILACLAFLFWVVGTSNTDVWKLAYPWWHQALGPVALAFGAFFIPVADGLLKKIGVPQD